MGRPHVRQKATPTVPQKVIALAVLDGVHVVYVGMRTKTVQTLPVVPWGRDSSSVNDEVHLKKMQVVVEEKPVVAFGQ